MLVKGELMFYGQYSLLLQYGILEKLVTLIEIIDKLAPIKYFKTEPKQEHETSKIKWLINKKRRCLKKLNKTGLIRDWLDRGKCNK